MGTGYKAADEFLAEYKAWKAKDGAAIPGARSRSEGSMDDRLRKVEHDMADVAQLIQEQHNTIQALGSRTEGQYEMLSKRLDKAAEEVMKIQTRLKKLEEDKSDGPSGD